jgi:Nif-specific ferredoxin III
MSKPVTITLPDGRSWTPKFVHAINEEKCIGCGRCFRVCGRDVLQLKGVNEDAEYEKKVMTIVNQMNCVGCEACAKICPKKCYDHEVMEAV